MTTFESDILKALVLLVTAPWWIPVVKHIVTDVLRADDGAPPEPGRRAPGGSDAARTQQLHVSDLTHPRRAGIYNSRWAIGRAPVRRRDSGGRG